MYVNIYVYLVYIHYTEQVAVDHAARVSAYNVTDVCYPSASNLTLLNSWDRDLGSKFGPGSEVDSLSLSLSVPL